MITEDYVSFETAKLLKEKGFNECPLYRYDDCGYLWVQGGYNKTIKWYFPAPTLQMACKWLRLVHNIHIQAFAPVYDMDCAKNGVTYNVVITNLADQCLAFDTPLDDIEYSSPEEAYEEALKYCLGNLINI